MDREKIMEILHWLAKSQWCWSRLYAELCNLYTQSYEDYDCVMSELESMNFKDWLDLVLYLEGNA